MSNAVILFTKGICKERGRRERVRERHRKKEGKRERERERKKRKGVHKKLWSSGPLGDPPPRQSYWK